MSNLEIILTAVVDDPDDYDRYFDAIADLVHGHVVPGVEVMCTGNGPSIDVHVFVDDEYDSQWNVVDL